MKLLHTSDWHVGKAIRGASRAPEHRAVLAEIASIAHENDVDLVVVAGDLFDSSSPSPEAEEIVYQGLLDLASTGADVAVIAGNHDHARRLRAVAPLLRLGRVHLVAEPVRPDEGGVRQLRTRDGADVTLAMLPFVSKRGIVRAEQLVGNEAFENAQLYSERMRVLIDALCSRFSPDSINVLVTHAFVLGGTQGGGERPAHLVEEYAIPAPAFPGTIGYAALGHLHRAQRIPAGPPVHYCGSPLQLDFGDTDHAKQVNLVTLHPGVPAEVEPRLLTAGRALRSVRGTLEELEALTAEPSLTEAWLRVTLTGTTRTGDADRVRELLGDGVVDVRIERAGGATSPELDDHHGRSPIELFADYLRHESIEDDRLLALFTELLEDTDSIPIEEST